MTFSMIVAQLMVEPQVGGDRERTTNGTKRKTNRRGLPRVKAVPGERYGKFTVISEGPRCEPDAKEWRERMWLARCDCGTQKMVRMGNLRCGAVKSCGCTNPTKFNSMTATQIRANQLRAK